MSQERFASTFYLRDYRGGRLYPIRYANTGAFQLTRRGAGMHTRENAIHVHEEDRAREMVRSRVYKIRAVRAAGDAPTLVGVGDRVAAEVVEV